MFDVQQLPDAWDTFYSFFGEKDRMNEGLYDIYYKISTAIFDHRIGKNLSQTQLANKLGVTQAMVSKLESGDYNYSVEQLWKVSQKLGLKLIISLEENIEEIPVSSLNEKQGQIIYYPDVAVG
ncbi:MAG: helix-turn-helix transcriptional regulator [Firmicutes bacterium]|jgi:transcriptional regulator with XRE-family HTH domain|nr:helix-turn-helix transcriptional regulator [Bacillota bacterium]